MAEFSGFSPDTIKFLAGLGVNNNKCWFEQNRAACDNHYVAPARAFVEAMAEPLRKIAPDICAEARINGSIFRINRDIRFSKDKTPYKDHIDLWFREGVRKQATSSFFFRLNATNVIIGAGAHRFDKDRLTTWRQAVVDQRSGQHTGKSLKKIINALEKKAFPQAAPTMP